jgi:hypothetical protein
MMCIFLVGGDHTKDFQTVLGVGMKKERWSEKAA